MMKTTHCIIIFVAVDGQGAPLKVRPWQPVTAEDIKLETYAQKLMELRKGIQEEMSPYRSPKAQA